MQTTFNALRDLVLGHVAGQLLDTRTSTALPGLSFWHSPCKTEWFPAMFNPKVYLMLQGAKRLTIGALTYDYTPGNYTVASVGLPYSGMVTRATPEAPYLGMELTLDPSMITRLLLEMPAQDEAEVPVLAMAPVTVEIVEPLFRLVRLLSTPEDIAMLAPLIERELYYRLLQGPMGSLLRQAVQPHTRFAQIRQAVDWICDHATMAMSVEELAARIGMSVTSFHRHFKAVTGLSPLAYQRHVRLLHARTLLGAQSNVTGVAYQVGYASSSQFSREYSRMFGIAPKHDVLRQRQAQGA